MASSRSSRVLSSVPSRSKRMPVFISDTSIFQHPDVLTHEGQPLEAVEPGGDLRVVALSDFVDIQIGGDNHGLVHEHPVVYQAV